MKLTEQLLQRKNDPRCDCPQVIYELEFWQTKPEGIKETEREYRDLMYRDYE